MENPIIFTISQSADFSTYSITTKDTRAKHNYGKPIKFDKVTDIFRVMEFVTRELNAEGYAVLFEVD